MVKIDLIGKKFGRLTVISEDGKRKKRDKIHWTCLCDCGNKIRVRGEFLRYRKTLSCGCLFMEHITTHGLTNTKTYQSWQAMKQRCLNKKNPRYYDYGGRGINICKEWQESFEAFYKDMGERPAGKSLDRINNEKGYYPKNCRWSIPLEQMSNIRCKGYKWDKRNKKWQAQIMRSGRTTHLGRFNTEEEAKQAYNHAKNKDWDQPKEVENGRS